MKKLLVIGMVVGLSFGASLDEGLKAVNIYNQNKNTINKIYQDSDKVIQEYTTIIVELQKELKQTKDDLQKELLIKTEVE